MKQAVQGGVIFSRTEMDGILTSEKIPPQYIISIAEDNKVIWSRAESNLEPEMWKGADAPTSPTAKVLLKARDDARDLFRMIRWTMTPAQGDLMLAPLQMIAPMTACMLTSRPQGRAVFTLLQSTLNHSLAPAPCAWLNTSAAK